MRKIETNFNSWDGTQLFYRAWLPKDKCEKALVLFHRGHEHSARFEELVTALGFDDIAVFAWDARGHGHSPGVRGYAKDIQTLVRDVDSFIAHIGNTYNIEIEKTIVLAHSVSAVIITAWVYSFAPRIRSMILATPAFDVKLYIPFARMGLQLYQRISNLLGCGPRFVKSYVSGKLLTHDLAEAKCYDQDPLISKQISLNILLELQQCAQRLINDAAVIHTDTLLLCAQADWVVRNAPQRRFFERLGAPTKRVEVLKGFYHSIFHEENRSLPIQITREFILDSFAREAEDNQLRDADRQGFSHGEYQWLKAGLPYLSARRIGFVLQKHAMNTVGRLSKGIKLGLETGFDSGNSLHYVYQNSAHGITSLGRLLDRKYLDATGWCGIRQRKKNLEDTIKDALVLVQQAKNGAAGHAISLVDIAGGPGRYLLDLVSENNVPELQISVRDYSARALAEGQALARNRGINGISFEKADAFSPDSYNSCHDSADIGIVSGLHELFPENAPVMRSLDGLHRTIRAGGYLIYTNQCWHPQLKMIAEVLSNREGKRWVMRCRSQAEMDKLVRAAGFEKVSQKIGSHGIFTVSLAKRV